MINSRYQASQGYGQKGQKDKCVQDGQIYQDLCVPDRIPLLYRVSFTTHHTSYLIVEDA